MSSSSARFPSGVPASAFLPRWRTLEWSLVAAALAAVGLAYISAHAHHFAVTANPAFPGWWTWTDQGRYLRAARAWSAWDLDPAQHWYFPGYPLLGAAFVALMPGQPFFLIDLFCLLAFGGLFVMLAARLAPEVPFVRAGAAAVFLVTVALTPLEMKAFVEPWTTTPTAPLTLLAILLAFRLWERPAPAGAFALGLATASVFLFRPTDAQPLVLSVGAATLLALRRRLSWRLVAAGAGGAAIPVALALGLYLVIFGPHESQYVEQSQLTGFDWRLVPLRWITIFVSPLPQFADEFSLSQTFPWIVPGIAGMVACLLACRGVLWLRHALVATAAVLHCALYLAYRDLHPPGLFRYGNYHYFKWCLPVFGLYALLLVVLVARTPRRWAAWAGGAAAVLFLFSWRVTWPQTPRDPGAGWASGRTLVLREAPQSVLDGVFVPASGGFREIYLDNHTMWIGRRLYQANAAFKAFPVPGGLMLTVMQPVPPAPAVVTFDEGITLQAGPPEFHRAKMALRAPRLLPVILAYGRRWLNAD